MTASSPPGADVGPAGAVPVCPRHPDRASYVRCQRCERPVCPDCQRPAAVGVQCVDCVRSQGKTGRVARTVFGARAGTSRPVVTQTLIAVCVGVYALQWFGGDRVTAALMFLPYEARAQPYRFLTSAFLHSPTFLLHIVMNMYALWLIGPYLEDLLGRARFAALYLLSAVGGSVGYYVLAQPSLDGGGAWATGALGASGAVFGLFSALVIVNRRLGRDIGGVLGVIVLNLVLGFWPGLNIAWQGHLGGLITGAAVAAVLVRAPAGHRGQVQVLGLVGVFVALLLLCVIKTLTVPSGVLL